MSEANAFGVDFALFADLHVDDFTNPLGAVNDLITGTGRDDQVFTNGGGIQSTPGQTGVGQSTMKLGFLGNDAAVFVKALDSVTDTTVLATPEVLVLNRQRADLLVGQQLGYLSTTNTETATTQTVEFLDIGTQLTVRPFVSNDGFVRLELRPSVSDGATRLEGGFVIPDKTTQELTTNVMVRSGQTIVLGGLFKEDTSIGRRQVPGLSSVPILGNAFKGQDDDVQRTEVIFLIKPTIMKDESLFAKGEQAEDDIELTRVGARNKLLPWSREKLTHSHLKKAYEYMRKGNRDKALWHVNLALNANPTMIEALRLKEKLTGQQLMVQDRSILDGAVDSMIDDALPKSTQPQNTPPQPEMNDESDAPANGDAQSAAPANSGEQAAPAAGDATEMDADTTMGGEKDGAGNTAENHAENNAENSAATDNQSDQQNARTNAQMEAAMQSAMSSMIEDEAGQPAEPKASSDNQAQSSDDAQNADDADMDSNMNQQSMNDQQMQEQPIEVSSVLDGMEE